MAKKSNYQPPQPKPPKDPRKASIWQWLLSPAGAALHNATLPPMNPAGANGIPGGAPGWGPPAGGGGTPGAGGPGMTNVNGIGVPSNIADRSSFQNTAFGTPAHASQIPAYVPEQGQGFQTLLRMALQGLGSTQGGFAPIAQQARQQFGEQTIPSIAERFTSMGGGGGRSSAFGQQLGASAANLETGLAASEGQYNQQQQKIWAILAQLGLTPQFESQYNARQPGLIEGGAKAAAQSLPYLFF
jgi:hypothetical protein